MAYSSFPQVSQLHLPQLSPSTTTHPKNHFFNQTQINFKINSNFKTKTTTPNNHCLKREKEDIFPTTQNTFQPLSSVSSNMWWAQLRAAFGQRFNLEGIIFSSKILTKHPHLLLPHLKVPNIRYINWEELHKRGFKGVVFDKDNTITLPYSLNLCDSLQTSIDECKSIFGQENVVVFSNSVGLYEYDPDEAKAEALERIIGVRVVRHKVKKPAGSGEEIEKQLGCKAMEIIMVGDRRFTDIVFGHKNGFFTVLTEPLTSKGENFAVKLVRKLEEFFVGFWLKRGLKVKSHCFLDNCDDVNSVRLNEPL